MAKIGSDQLLVPSVLDRLIDYEPGNSKEAPKNSTQVLREMKESVRRDLENLLNTRWRCGPMPPDLKELEVSLVSYGIPDFTGIRLGNAREREDFRRTIERTIKNFEPRFKTVTVKFLENASETDRTMRFRVDAMLYAEPAPEPVIFDTAMEPTKGTFSVKGTAR
jgi:type VI secretion system protein ImpF